MYSSSETDVLEIPPDGQDIKSQALSVGAHTGAHSRITADQFTAGFETIGSCSLEPAEKNTNDGYKDRGGVASQLQLSSQSSIETNAIEKATEVNSVDLHILGVPTTGFTASEANEEKNTHGMRSLIPSQATAYALMQRLSQKAITSPIKDSLIGSHLLARRQQPMQQSSNHSTEKTLRQKLKSTEKWKLRELKSKNWTLRQIGPHFADIDMTWLRQAWMDIKPPQRCTRSRATQID